LLPTHWPPRGSPAHWVELVVHTPAEQHALLHGDVSEQAVVQACVTGSQACPE
jgi:hypothetical protein